MGDNLNAWIHDALLRVVSSRFHFRLAVPCHWFQLDTIMRIVRPASRTPVYLRRAIRVAIAGETEETVKSRETGTEEGLEGGNARNEESDGDFHT